MAKRDGAVKDCARCGGRKKPATQTRRWGLDKDQLEIDLCDEHGSAFDRDMGMWSRLSRDITPDVYKHQYEMTRERGIDRAARSLFAVTPPEDPRVVVVQKLPAKFHTWQLSDHAKQRCEERGISERDALLTAADPAFVVSARSEPTNRVHFRGEVAAVVNPNRSVVITVMSRQQAEQEQEVASASN